MKHQCNKQIFCAKLGYCNSLSNRCWPRIHFWNKHWTYFCGSYNVTEWTSFISLDRNLTKVSALDKNDFHKNYHTTWIYGGYYFCVTRNQSNFFFKFRTQFYKNPSFLSTVLKDSSPCVVTGCRGDLLRPP